MTMVLEILPLELACVILFHAPQNIMTLFPFCELLCINYANCSS